MPVKKLSHLEETFALHVRAEKLIVPEREYRFAAQVVGGPGKGLRDRLKEAGLKDWRFDFAWPDQKVAVEAEGGVWTNGRHTRGAGFVGDLDKYNAAALLGWKVLRFHVNAITDGTAIRTVAPLVRQPTYSPGII